VNAVSGAFEPVPPVAAKTTPRRVVLAIADALSSASSLRYAHYWVFRLGAFASLNVLDDPAWLALIFC
jgi:hypothetical protein